MIIQLDVMVIYRVRSHYIWEAIIVQECLRDAVITLLLVAIRGRRRISGIFGHGQTIGLQGMVLKNPVYQLIASHLADARRYLRERRLKTCDEGLLEILYSTALTSFRSSVKLLVSCTRSLNLRAATVLDFKLTYYILLTLVIFSACQKYRVSQVLSWALSSRIQSYTAPTIRWHWPSHSILNDLITCEILTVDNGDVLKPPPGFAVMSNSLPSSFDGNRCVPESDIPLKTTTHALPGISTKKTAGRSSPVA